MSTESSVLYRGVIAHLRQGSWDQESILWLASAVDVKELTDAHRLYMQTALDELKSRRDVEQVVAESKKSAAALRDEMQAAVQDELFDDGSLEFHFKWASILPQGIVEDNELTESIVCCGISGGADYVDGMPRTVNLHRRTNAGGNFFADYVQQVKLTDDESKLIRNFDSNILEAIKVLPQLNMTSAEHLLELITLWKKQLINEKGFSLLNFCKEHKEELVKALKAAYKQVGSNPDSLGSISLEAISVTHARWADDSSHATFHIKVDRNDAIAVLINRMGAHK